jgi:FkbM family methyltransferase
MTRGHLRVAGFRIARGFLHRVLIPLLMRTGPLEAVALRLLGSIVPDQMAHTGNLPCPMDVDGLKLWYDAERPSITIRGLVAGSYEQPIADLLNAELRPGMTMLDVGAHIGYFSLLAARRIGATGRVWSFEPDPANRASLVKNLEVNGMSDRAQVVPLAVTASVGESHLYRVPGDTGSSTVYAGRLVRGDPLAVGTTSLDAWARSQDWPRVDLVKIDVEGAECAVLAGMSELVSRNPGIVVVLEFQAEALEAAGEVPLDFLRELMVMGRHVIELLDDRGNRPLDEHTDLQALIRLSRWAPLNIAMRMDSPSD